ncbi:MAG: WYL domain-containing protein [Clostridiales bacterium]|nr:WYL domain-containing protein [Clostridiales bacterium]
MFHLAAYRGFTIFNEAFPIDGIVTDFGKTVGTAVDPEINLGKVFIVHDFGTFLDTKIMLIVAMKEYNTHFRISVSVAVSQQFFAWVFGLGKAVRIVAPESVKEQMKKALQDIAERYE